MGLAVGNLVGLPLGEEVEFDVGLTVAFVVGLAVRLAVGNLVGPLGEVVRVSRARWGLPWGGVGSGEREAARMGRGAGCESEGESRAVRGDSQRQEGCTCAGPGGSLT